MSCMKGIQKTLFIVFENAMVTQGRRESGEGLFITDYPTPH